MRDKEHRGLVRAMRRHRATGLALAFALALTVALLSRAHASDPLEELRTWQDPVFQRQALTLARRALEAWVGTGVVTEATVARWGLRPCEAFLRQKGIFVSIERRRPRVVRGCRGTLLPRHPRLLDELVANVREAALRDPLHRPVTRDELANLRIILCVPGNPTEVWEDGRWDPQFFGLLVQAGERAAVMLPWEAPDCARQVAWGRKRARLARGEPATLFCFPAVRFAEPVPGAAIPESTGGNPESPPWW